MKVDSSTEQEASQLKSYRKSGEESAFVRVRDRAAWLLLSKNERLEFENTSNLKYLQEKIQEYLDNGTRLGFLIDCKNCRVEIYQPNAEVQVLERPSSLSGGGILPGFVLDLTEVWR